MAVPIQFSRTDLLPRFQRGATSISSNPVCQAFFARPCSLELVAASEPVLFRCGRRTLPTDAGPSTQFRTKLQNGLGPGPGAI